MKITKTKVAPKALPPVFILEEPKQSWGQRILILVLSLGLIFSLTRCASAPTDISTLQQENAKLRALLEECESDAKACLDYLQECEALRAK